MGTDLLGSRLASVGEGHVDEILCKGGTLTFTFAGSLSGCSQSQIHKYLEAHVKAASFLLEVIFARFEDPGDHEAKKQ